MKITDLNFTTLIVGAGAIVSGAVLVAGFSMEGILFG
ncbi:hypothetical protein MNBD_GAMMA16-1201 [hydrothermal vent metagenome]|uniref:Uncharacterized protein n=1 Tax=hydrothermal vent metagenome TaxID=652676 RepID=A0A3B0ZSU5_9ZZZZ